MGSMKKSKEKSLRRKDSKIKMKKIEKRNLIMSAKTFQEKSSRKKEQQT